MRAFSDRFARWFQKVLPSPFTIAVVLTAVAMVLAFAFGEESSVSSTVLNWEKGLWNKGLLVFAFQMMLMLVLGHVLALSTPAERLISFITSRILSSGAKAAASVAFFTMLTGLFNWGFGLIFGAILARKVGEEAARRNISINYPLIGAAGYTGLLVWHGGLSGSSLIKVAEDGHLASLMEGAMSTAEIAQLPASIGLSETVFSPMNLVASLIILLVIPAFFYLSGKGEGQKLRMDSGEERNQNEAESKGAERLDTGRGVAMLTGLLFIGVAIYKPFTYESPGALLWINPNWINLLLFGLALVFHGSVVKFLSALNHGILGASGILVQFPLYFGIMGVITGSGLIDVFSELMVISSNETTYPIFTFFSAAVVNVFVPSGGGQWAVQGAIIIKAASELNIPLSKCILALAYGDQVTNMLQPFWALPLLGITGLKAKEILPYTLIAMMLAILVFVMVLLIF